MLFRSSLTACFVLSLLVPSAARADETTVPTAPLTSGPKTLGALGWGLAALGTGGLTASVVTFVLHADTVDRTAACSQLGYAASPFPAPRCDMEAIQSELDGLEAANITAFSLGLAAAGAGATMILVDHFESTGASVALSPSGAELQVRF
jgi:hypothetical protein